MATKSTDLKAFFANHVEKVADTEYIASKRIKDESGNPMKWILRPISNARMDEIQRECTYYPKDKNGVEQQRLDTTKYISMITAETVVWPDLNNAELQDSWKVLNPCALLQVMLSVPGEYQKLKIEAQRVNGMMESMNDMVDDAKNS